MSSTANFQQNFPGFLFLATSIPLSLLGWTGALLSVVVTFTLYLTWLCRTENIFQMSLLCGHYAFFLYPLLLHTYFDENAISDYVSIVCCIGVYLGLLLSDSLPSYQKRTEISFGFNLFLLVFVIYMALLAASDGISYEYTIPYLVVAFHMLSLSHRTHRKLVTIASAFALGVISVATYFVFFSTGFARLTLASPLFAITLILFNWLCLPFRKPLLVGFVLLGSFAGSLMRSQSAWRVEDIAYVALSDSTATPILLFDEILHTFYGGATDRLWQWVEQVSLFILAPFPRQLWLGKPLGFGFLYTVENLPAYLVEARHSVAALYPGEHIYFLGPILGLVGTGVAIAMVCGIWHFFCRAWNGYLAVGIATNIPTFYWGGIQPYATRNLLWLLPAIVIVTIVLWGRRKANVTANNSGVARSD